MDTAAYIQFLESKIQLARSSGEDIDDVMLHPSTFPHQRDAIHWGLKHGRAMIAMSFGLGKTQVQCELARILHERSTDPFLVVCPLGVKHQFADEDGPRLGVRWQYVRTDDEIRRADTPYLITNYERVRDGDIDPRKHRFAGASLDEGSVLRSLGSKTYGVFEQVFADVPYRYVCTATPAPNNYRELIYYARWLGVMDSGQALTRWFDRNPEKAGDLRLHPQHEADFWLWVSSWALFLYRPSDMGYSDEGYELPELKVHYHRLSVDHTRAWSQVDNLGQRRMILDAANGVREAIAEKRATLADRVEKAKEIMEANPDRHWLIWHHLEDERRAIEKAMPEAVTVYGSQDLEVREGRILDFSRGKFPVLATKPEIAGSGCNFQRHCYSNVFLGIDYKFQDFIQAIHRTRRYLQPHDPVDVHIIYAESEDRVMEVLQHKWQQHDELVEKMRGIIRQYGLDHSAMSKDLARKIGVTRAEVVGKWFKAVCNDTVLETPALESDSVGLIHTSIPFGNHYEYTTNYEDFGHNDDDTRFFEQMDFFIPELYRVLKPGRIAAIHVKDRILYGHQTPSGFMAVSPFSDQTVAAFMKHGFLYQGRRTIVTDVVRENNSTYRLGWTEMTKDASKMGSGLPEYLLLFRKPPSNSADQRADEPVTKSKEDYTRGRWQVDAHALWRSSGNRLLHPDELAQYAPDQVSSLYEVEQLNTVYDHERHVAICEVLDERGHLPSTFMLLAPKVTRDEADMVWDNVVYMRTLNVEQHRERERHHICPLPLDIVERTIRLYSNPGDVVYDPFAGLFTVSVIAIQMGRYGHGVELNEEYFEAGVRYCRDAERKAMMPTLFDFAGIEVKPSDNGKEEEHG